MSPQYVWVRTGIPPKCKLSAFEKAAIKSKADELLEEHFRPLYVKPPKTNRFN